jgi:hypothetical protein
MQLSPTRCSGSLAPPAERGERVREGLFSRQIWGTHNCYKTKHHLSPTLSANSHWQRGRPEAPACVGHRINLYALAPLFRCFGGRKEFIHQFHITLGFGEAELRRTFLQNGVGKILDLEAVTVALLHGNLLAFFAGGQEAFRTSHSALWGCPDYEDFAAGQGGRLVWKFKAVSGRGRSGRSGW